MGRPQSHRSKRDVERARAAAMAVPRPYRAQFTDGELLAILPQAVQFSYLWTGSVANERTDDNIAIVTVHGPLDHHATWWWDSYESIVERVEGAMTGTDEVREHEARNRWREDFKPMSARPASAVVLKIDSPGGEAAGAGAAHKALRSLRMQYGVPLYTYANEMACSAGYEIGCAADELWLPETGIVGSVGVVMTTYDLTGAEDRTGEHVELISSGDFKADYHAYRALTDDIRDRLRARVFELAQPFFDLVAAARNTTPRAVAGLQANTFCGPMAVDVGLADGVAEFPAFLRMIADTLKTPDTTAASVAA